MLGRDQSFFEDLLDKRPKQLMPEECKTVKIDNLMGLEKLVRQATATFNESLGGSATADPKWRDVILKFGPYKGAMVELLQLLGHGEQVQGMDSPEDAEVFFVPGAVVSSKDPDDDEDRRVLLIVSTEGIGLYEEEDGIYIEEDLETNSSWYLPASEKEIQGMLKFISKQEIPERKYFRTLQHAIQQVVMGG